MNTQERFGAPVVSVTGLLVLVGDGDADPGLLKRLYADGATVIAADGGADLCARAGVVPKAIIGDMDSVRDLDQWGDKTEIIHLKEQETTDFEKCLYATSARLTVALGMVGDRLDHTLSAFDVVGRYAARRAIIVAGRGDAAAAIVGKFDLSVSSGSRVSVWPLEPVVFARSEGLAYPLNGLTLAPGARTGVSNRASDQKIVIEPETNGAYLVIVDIAYLGALMKPFLQTEN